MPDAEGASAAVSAFAEQLQALRRAQGMPSFTELARRTGHPRSTLHDALRGERLPSLEVTRAVVAACGGADAEWHQRWMAASAAVQEARAGRSRTLPAAPEPAAEARRPWWWRHRLVTAFAALGLVAAVVLAVVWFGGAGCTPEREYRIAQDGALLAADGSTIGQVRVGDVVLVESLAHDRFPHRRFSTVVGSGARGYVDESKLAFLRTTCA